MKYFSYISHTLSLKNNLEKAVAQFLQSKERVVVDESDIEAFKKELLDGIQELNETHKRCTPIKASFWQPHRSGDFHLSGAGFCTFHLFKSKN